jgi:hypothetical protein
MTRQDVHRFVERLSESAVDEAARRLEELLEAAPAPAESDLTPQELAFVHSLPEEIGRHGDVLDPDLWRQLEAQNHPWLWVGLASATELGPELDSERPHLASSRGAKGRVEPRPPSLFSRSSLFAPPMPTAPARP